ncbi:alkaline phosphatase family protein [Aliirhizobium smilacinae]|uniref:Alkaline phosphatase family protein n=1 Tax=Aliirhizobium smilacinae TaxID=1395944 RepID=A0A5C4XPE5_9HYPH|nr:alkaline phosphatase family protein [Rhizobium smilacinae]TNM65345.1 alkaline phosphatase family protein [Rhizobium smilacinae]
MSLPLSKNRVLLIVFDGLRPDLINQETMPNLCGFAKRATWFKSASSVFPSMTRVATASIATGCHPAKHGVMGNAFFLPAFASDQIFDTGIYAHIQKVETSVAGGLVTATTFGDQASNFCKSVSIVHTGSPGAAFCLNPRAAKNGQWTFSIHGRDATQTPHAVDEMVKRFGPLPLKEIPQYQQTDYARRVLVEYVLPLQKPDVAVIWFNEPDTSFHYKSLKSDDTTSILHHLDGNFGQIIDFLDSQAGTENYTVIVASDHGHVTITDEVDLYEALQSRGHKPFSSRRALFEDCVIAVTGWNVGEITTLDNDHNRISEIASWLQSQEFTGCLFSRNKDGVRGELPGTFSFDLLGISHQRQPDLMYTLKDTNDCDLFGARGTTQVVKGGQAPVGGGMHGGLNRSEMNSTLMVSGPLFKAGQTSHVACGIIDIAPTILDLIGVPLDENMDGRSLMEHGTSPLYQQRNYYVEARSYAQTLGRSESGRSFYIHDGCRI